MTRLLNYLGLNPWAPPIDDEPLVEEPPLSVRQQALELAAVAALVVVTIAAAAVVLA